MKHMLLGIFLMVLSIWCLVYGKLDELPIVMFLGLLLPLIAVVFFVGGFSSKKK